MHTMLLISIFHLLVHVSAEAKCGVQGFPPADLPSCTDYCIVGDTKMYDGHCANDIDGICGLGLDNWQNYLEGYDNCIWNSCDDDEDLYKFVEILKRSCLRARVTITSIKGDLSRYMSRTSTSGSAETSTSTSSTPVTTTTSSLAIPDPRSSQVAPTSTPDAPSNPNPPQTTNGPAPPASVPPNEVTTTVEVHGGTGDTGHSESIPSHGHPSATASDTTKPDQPKTNTPIIAGAAAGGTALLALAFGTVFYLLRRRSRSQASTPPSWDPSHGTHGKPTLPDLDGSSLAAGGLAGAAARREKTTEPDIPDRYASHTSHSIHQGQKHQHVAPGPLMTQQHSNHDMTKQHFMTSNHHQHLPINNMSHAQQPRVPHHHPSVPKMRFNDSPYPEFETRSSPPPARMSPAPTLHTMNSWRVPSPLGASELHNENIGSPVSELGDTSAVVRMKSSGGLSELGGTRMDSRELGGGGHGQVELGEGRGYAEMRGDGNGYAEVVEYGTQARPRYYGNDSEGGDGNAGHVTGGVAQNF